MSSLLGFAQSVLRLAGHSCLIPSYSIEDDCENVRRVTQNVQFAAIQAYPAPCKTLRLPIIKFNVIIAGYTPYFEEKAKQNKTNTYCTFYISSLGLGLNYIGTILH